MDSILTTDTRNLLLRGKCKRRRTESATSIAVATIEADTVITIALITTAIATPPIIMGMTPTDTIVDAEADHAQGLIPVRIRQGKSD